MKTIETNEKTAMELKTAMNAMEIKETAMNMETMELDSITNQEI